MKLNGNLTFNTSGQSELQNATLERSATAPSGWAGRIYYNTTDNKYYSHNGTSWVAFATGGDASALQTEVDSIETSLGGMVNSSGVFQGAPFTTANAAVWGSSPTSLMNALDTLADYAETAAGVDTLAELTDVNIAGVADTNILQYVSASSKWEDRAIGSASGVQAYDADLDALAALATTGIAVRTGASTWATRSITAPAAGFTISNADGVSGSPTFALANDLAALEGLATTGYIIRTGDGTAVTRSITGTTGRVVVTNGDGVASDTNIDLGTVAQGAAGSFLKITIDSYGRVSANTAVTTSDITTLVDSEYVNISGDTMTGNLNMGSNKITSLANGTNATDGVNKAQLDAAIAGLTWKQPVKAASTGDLTLSGAQTVDGVSLVATDRVLVKNQTVSADNGIYIVNAGAWTRSTDFDSLSPVDEINSAAVFVMQGTVNSDYAFTVTSTVATLGTDSIVFSQFTGASAINAGIGLSQSGNTINVNLGAGIVELPTDEVGIHLYDSATGALILSSDGSTRSTTAGSSLYLLLNAAGGLVQDVNGLKINASSVTNAMLSTGGAVTLNADSGSGSIVLGDTLLIQGSATQGISTSVASGTYTVTAVNATTTQKGVASFDTSHFSVSAGAVSLAATLDDLTNVSSADVATTNDVLTKTAGDWQPVSRATILGTESINSLSDVVLASPADGHALINDGTNWVNQKIYHLYQGASATSHTVVHNIGQRYCNVTVIDDTTNEVVIPESITFDSTIQLTVTFNAALACKVVVMGVS